MRLPTNLTLLRPSSRFLFSPSPSLLSRRYLATPAPPTPPPSSTPSSSSFTGSLPASVQAAFKTNPVLIKLIGDEIARRNLKAIGEEMYKSGIGKTGDGKPTALEMSKLMMNSELRNAIQGLTASMTRLGISMADLQPIMADLMAQGGLDSFAPSSPTSSTPVSPPPAPAKPDPVMDAFKAKAELYREVIVEEIEEEKHEKEVKEEKEAGEKKLGAGLFSKIFGGGKK